jgi:hypothetical protein
MTKFDDLECREFVLGEENGFEVVLYQAEIIRLIKVLTGVRSDYLAKKFKRLIFIRDYTERTKTDFKKECSKADVGRYMHSDKEYDKYLADQRDFDKEMRDYYGKDV